MVDELELSVVWLRDKHLNPNLLGLHGSCDFPRRFLSQWVKNYTRLGRIEQRGTVSTFQMKAVGLGGVVLSRAMLLG